MRAILLASATATTLNGLRARSCVSQGLLRLLSRELQHRMSSDHQNASQIAIALFRDLTGFCLPPVESCCGTSPARLPGRHIAARPECLWVRDRGDNGGRAHQTNPRDAPEPLACFVRAMMSNNPLLDRCDQRPHRLELRRQHDQAGVSLGLQALIRGARNDRQQLPQPCVPLCSCNAKLGHMRPQGIDHLGPLPHQKIARPMQHQLGLRCSRPI